MEAIAGAAAIALLIWIFASESNKGSGYKKGDLKISRDSNGQWYVYETETGREVYRADSKKECAAFVRDCL